MSKLKLKDYKIAKWEKFFEVWKLNQNDPDPPAEVVKGENGGVDYWKINLKLK